MVMPDPVPVPVLPPIADPAVASAPLVQVPSGCAAPTPEQAVFIGSMVAADTQTARFAVRQVRSGSVDGFVVDGLIDVRYGDEVRFLEVGESYIVGAGLDLVDPALVSTVRTPSPLFGGSEIAGIDDSDVDCPSIEDPVRTLLVDGTSVETGVLSPLRGSGEHLARAVIEPAVAALAILVGLVAMKHLLVAFGRSLLAIGRRAVANQPD